MPTLFTIRPNIPKRLFDTVKLERALERALDIAAHKGVKELQNVTSSWDHPPTFTVRVTKWQRVIVTTSKVFKYVDEGTRPHIITPKKANIGFLQFESGYHPKTVVGSFASRPGGSFGPYMRAKAVSHPGIEARNFSAEMNDIIQDVLVKEVEDAIRAALGGATF